MPPALSQKDQRSYRGVRQRSWGKWVSEVREPKKRSRIWLGSYHTQEAAARAYDTALVYLRGPSARLNFPNSPPAVPLSDAYPAASPKSIQRAALEEGSRFDRHLNAQAGTASSRDEIDAVAVQLATTADAQRKSEGPRKPWDDTGPSPSEAPSEREQKPTNSSVGTRFLCRPEDVKPLAIIPHVQDGRKHIVTASEPSADGYGGLSYLPQESMTAYSPENERKMIRSCVSTPFSSAALAAQQRVPMPDAPPATDFSRFAGFCLLPIAADHPPWWPSADEICD